MFLLFLKRTDVLASRLCVVFLRLVSLGSFPACWRQATVTPIPKGPPSPSVVNYRPISITSVLSKLFDLLVSVRLGRFMESSGVLPTIQFAYRKCVGTSDAHVCVSHTLKSALESEQEARIVQVDFCTAFDRGNHHGIALSCRYWRFCVVYMIEFLSNRSQHVMVDSCHSKLVNVVSGVPQGSVLGPLLFLLYTSELFSIFFRISRSVMLMNPLC